jgi:hypothetical protein
MEPIGPAIWYRGKPLVRRSQIGGDKFEIGLYIVVPLFVCVVFFLNLNTKI